MNTAFLDIFWGMSDHEMHMDDYIEDDAVNDALWRDVLAALSHAQQGEVTTVYLQDAAVARIVPPPWIHEATVQVAVRRERLRSRWSPWRGPFQDVFT